MFDFLRDKFSSITEGGRLQLANLRNRRAMAEIVASTLEEASNTVTERQGADGWNMTGRSRYAHTAADQQSMIKQCRNAARFDPNGRAALLTAVYYIVGEGVKVTPQSKDPRVHRLWREFWTSPRNRMATRFGELVLRTLRDGEAFLEYFNTSGGAATWKTTVRFRDPELLTQPSLEFRGTSGDDGSQGIQVDASDPETALKYFFRPNYTEAVRLDVRTPEQIQHIKILADSEQKRGESYLQAALDMFAQYKDWLRYRIILNKVRTAIVLVRKVEGGTSDDVRSIANNISASSTARDGETKKRMPRAGTILNANGNVDYRFESANINANDASEDGRNIKLGMAAATNMPEYVFGDASNANYASTLIAESPFVKGMKFWQTFFEQHLKEMFRRVVKAAVDAGKLNAPAEEDIFKEPGVTDVAEAEQQDAKTKPAQPQGAEGADPESDQPVEGEPPQDEESSGSMISEAEAFWGCDVQWPEIVHRDMKATTEAIIAQQGAGLISDSTAAQILQHDYDEEVRRQRVIEEDADNNPFKGKAGGDGPFGDDPEAQAEIDEVMKGLSPEEADEILKSGDASKVMALVKKKKGRPAQGGGRQPFPPAK